METERLEFGGKEFELKPLTLNDWIEAEDLGLDITRLQKKDVKIRDMRTLVYVALHKADPTVAIEWVGENLALDNMEVFNKIVGFIMPKGSQVSETT